MTAENGTDPMTHPMTPLDIFVGVWRMRASLSGDAEPAAETTFEWLTGKQFLVQRWQVDYPDAPDGIAVVGFDAEKATHLQHYFDSRGVARVYEMSFSDGVWTLLRMHPGFCQRFVGTFSDDGNTITGRWEFSSDGISWEPDFDLTYTRSTP